MMIDKIKVMADYEATGLWLEAHELTLEDLPELPNDFWKELKIWNDQYVIAKDNIVYKPISKELNDDGLYFANFLHSYYPGARIEFWGWKDNLKPFIEEIVND